MKEPCPNHSATATPPGVRSSAFSLVELLVVVSIIAVLLGLVLPAAIALRQAAKRKEAAVQARTLVHAVTAYKTAYGKWPAQTQGDNDTTHTNSALIIAALTVNPRQLRFMEIPPAGLLNDCYVDPWKRSFVVAMDENGDGNVEINLSTFGTPSTVTVSNQTVAVASGGPDPAQESKRIYSWKP